MHTVDEVDKVKARRNDVEEAEMRELMNAIANTADCKKVVAGPVKGSETVVERSFSSVAPTLSARWRPQC